MHTQEQREKAAGAVAGRGGFGLVGGLTGFFSHIKIGGYLSRGYCAHVRFRAVAGRLETVAQARRETRVGGATCEGAWFQGARPAFLRKWRLRYEACRPCGAGDEL